MHEAASERWKMPALLNTRSRYGIVNMLLHWSMAALLVGLVILGLYMTSLPDVGFDTRKVWLYIYHKEFGVFALVLATIRLAWTATGTRPALPGGVAEWQNVSARFVQLAFYGLMFALPVTGWLMSSASAIPVSFFGLFDLPDLVPRDEPLFRALVTIHHLLGYALMALLSVHAGAALRHHFVLRDATLRRMLP